MIHKHLRIVWIFGLLLGTDAGAQQTLSACADALETSALEVLVDVRHRLGTANRPQMGADISGDEAPSCVVFLSVSEGQRGFTTLGRASNLADAITAAVAQQPTVAEPESLWVRMDVVDQSLYVPVSGTIGSFDRAGIVGMADSSRFSFAFHPEEMLSYGMVDSDGNLRIDRARRFMNRFPHRAPIMPVNVNAIPTNLAHPPQPMPDMHLLFSVKGFALTPTAHGARLFRGNRIAQRSTAASLTASAKAAGVYLRRNVAADGHMGYNYLAQSGRYSDDYNIRRHAGTLYTLFQLYQLTGENELRVQAERALEFLRRQFRACPHVAQALCVVEDNEIKLGGLGQAILALLSHPALSDHPELIEDAKNLGRAILAMQEADGRFEPHVMSWPGGDAADLVSIYYPGEAVFALARLYGATKDAGWLKAAVGAARYLILTRDAGMSDLELPQDHWLVYGLREIESYSQLSSAIVSPSGFGPDERRTYLRRMAGAIVDAQNRPGLGMREPDWQGGYFQPPRTAPTATRMEALVTMIDLLGKDDPRFEKTPLAATLCKAADYVLRTQFTEASAIFLAEPERVLGGFRRSLTDFQLRIDISQHAISALLGMARLIDEGEIDCGQTP